MNFTVKKNAVLFNLTYLGVLVAFLLTLLILPKDFFDNKPSVCPSILIFNKPCSACGLSRATLHFIHLDFKKAIEYNELVLIVAPIMLVIYLVEIFFTMLKTKQDKIYIPFSFPYELFKVDIKRKNVWGFIFGIVSFLISLLYFLSWLYGRYLNE
jgi:hypothetical protein